MKGDAKKYIAQNKGRPLKDQHKGAKFGFD